MNPVIPSQNSDVSSDTALPDTARRSSDIVNMRFTFSLSRLPMALAASTLAPSPSSMLKQLKNMVSGIAMFIADMASVPIIWLTIAESVVTASCAAIDVSIDALRKFLSAFDVTNPLRACSAVFVPLIGCSPISLRI